MSTPSVTDQHDLWGHVHPAASRRLLLAALDAFAEHGFRAATTRQIAERAGLSPAGVYVHYRSKVEMLFEITRIGHVAVLSESKRAIEGVSDPAARLRAFVTAFTAWHLKHHTLARVTQYEINALEPKHIRRLRPLRWEFEQIVDDTLHEGIQAGAFAVSDVQAARMAVLSMGIDVARWGGHGPRYEPDALGTAYADLVLRMVEAR